MLPPHLKAVYTQARDDTNEFLAWLDITSRTCGYTYSQPPTTSPSARLHRRRSTTRLRQAQRGNSRHGLSIRQLKAQVDTIINSSITIRMPRNIQTRVQRAIEARTTCLTWYDGVEHTTNEFNEDGHRFFISFLQESLEKFREKESSILKPSNPATNKKDLFFQYVLVIW